jgi:hypothetical protein
MPLERNACLSMPLERNACLERWPASASAGMGEKEHVALVGDPAALHRPAVDVTALLLELVEELVNLGGIGRAGGEGDRMLVGDGAVGDPLPASLLKCG